MADTSADETTDPAGTVVDPAAPDPADSSTSPSAKVSDSELSRQLAESQAANEKLKTSNDALESNSKKLIEEKKGEKQKKLDALEQQGKFEEVSKLQAVAIEEQKLEIEQLRAALQQAMGTQATLDATLAEVNGYVTAEMEGLSDEHKAQLNEQCLSFGGYATLDAMPPTQQLRAVRTYKANLALATPNGLGGLGTGTSAGQRESAMQAAEKSGNVDELLKNMFK